MSSTAKKYYKEIQRENRDLKYVKLGLIRVSPKAQRDFIQHWADKIFSEFSLEKFGTPEVSQRDGQYYIIDGQHRIYALKQWLGKGWEDQMLECWVSTGLSEKVEADRFLALNNRLKIAAFASFKISVTGCREIETKIESIVNSEQLLISREKVQGAIMAVGTLIRAYK